MTSGKEFWGVNVFLPSLVRHCTGYESPCWLTYKQAQERGGHVRRGENGTGIVFWKWLDTATDQTDGEPVSDRILLVRQYTVYNAAQCDGIEPMETAEVQRHDWEPLAESERIVAGMPDAPSISEGSPRACYIPSQDRIEMPHRHWFTKPETFYSTLFHELAHSTGHERRLNRHESDAPRMFGGPDYSREELGAEIGAVFLSGHAGNESQTLDTSAADFSGWGIARRHLRCDRAETRFGCGCFSSPAAPGRHFFSGFWNGDHAARRRVFSRISRGRGCDANR